MRNNLRQQIWFFVLIVILTFCGMLIQRAPDALAQLETVVVAVSIAPPFVAEDETGTLTGFDIDLINALAAQADLPITYTKTATRYLLPGVATRLYDVGSGCLSITPEREAQVHFTRPYFATGLTMVVQTTTTTLINLADLTPEMAVGVVEESTAQAFVQSQSTALVHPVLHLNDVLAKVETGELDAAIVNETDWLGYQLSHPDAALKTVGNLLAYHECGLVVNQTDTTLLDQLDAALTEIKSNGTYDRLYRKWFDERAVPEKPVEPLPTEVATPLPSPTPLPLTVVGNLSLTTTSNLAGIYYLTVGDETGSEEAVATQEEQGGERYQILTLAANGLWFVSEAPAPVADSGVTHDRQTGQPGLWFINVHGQVEAMLITFTVPATDTGEVTVTRKDYQMQIDGNGTVVGAYHTTHYATDLFALPAAPTVALTQTVEFTGQRVQ